MLYNSVYFQVSQHSDHVEVVRTALPFESIMAMILEQSEVLRVLHAADAEGVLVDVRMAVGRSDPAFEDALTEWRRTLERNFMRVAVLMRTKVGALQGERLARADRATSTRVFTSHKDALDYARGQAT